MNESRNRKLIHVTSSNERLKHKCVDVSDHDIVPSLVHSSSTTLSIRWNVPNSHNLKIQDGGDRHNFGKMSITPDWI